MKRKVKRFNEGEFIEDNYARNENREGRMSTLDPSDIEDAIRGRMMTGKLGEVEYFPNITSSRVASEYDSQSGLDYAPSMGSRKPIAATRPTVKPPAKPVVKPPEKPVASMGRTAMGKTAEQEAMAQPTRSRVSRASEVPSVAEVEKQRATTGTGTDLATKTKQGLSDTAEKALAAAGAGAGAFGAYKLAKMLRSPASKTAGLLGRSEKAGETLSKDMGPVQYAAGRRSMLQNQRGEGVITPKAPPRGGGTDPGARRPTRDELDIERMGSDYMRKGGKVKKYKSGGSVSSASKRADGIAMRGKTRGKYI